MEKTEIIFYLIVIVIIGYLIFSISEIDNNINKNKEIMNENFTALSQKYQLINENFIALSYNNSQLIKKIYEINSTLAQKIEKLSSNIVLEKEKYGELERIYEKLEQEKGITKKSYREVMNFLEEDETDKNKYVPGKYDCKMFSSDVVKHALAKNILACTVVIDFPSGGHEVVLFPTVDRKNIFIEPQSDRIVDPKIGKVYWDRRYYSEPDYNDTIINIIYPC